MSLALAGQIVEGPIAFVCLCEHHALPFHGVAHVGYIAGDQIIGISKLTRLVRLFARRFTVQERLGEQIADTLDELDRAARRRRPPRRLAPLHTDARRRGASFADSHHVLARRVRGTGAAGPSSSRRCGHGPRASPRGLGRPQPTIFPTRWPSAIPGRFGFDGPRVVANFVSTLDGVVAIPGLARANRLIADENDDDRFVMGLLRAAADVVLIGSGTLQASPNGLWTPASTYPDVAGDWAELRRRLGRPPEPALAVITGTGGVDPNHPAFDRGALVLTTDAGAQALSGSCPGPQRSSRWATARSSTSGGRWTTFASVATS